jgi:hypothetical protein
VALAQGEGEIVRRRKEFSPDVLEAFSGCRTIGSESLNDEVHD